jgi:hypothetical protein
MGFGAFVLSVDEKMVQPFSPLVGGRARRRGAQI